MISLMARHLLVEQLKGHARRPKRWLKLIEKYARMVVPIAAIFGAASFDSVKACRIQLQHRLCRHRLHLPRAHHWCWVDVAACAAFDSADLMPTVAAAALAMAVAAARTAAVCITTAPCMPLMSVSMCGGSGLSVE